MKALHRVRATYQNSSKTNEAADKGETKRLVSGINTTGLSYLCLYHLSHV